MSEAIHAVQLANKVLDNPSLDPDGDLAVLARQFLRAKEARVKLEAAMLEARDKIGELAIDLKGSQRDAAVAAADMLAKPLGLPGGLSRFVVEPDQVEF